MNTTVHGYHFIFNFDNVRDQLLVNLIEFQSFVEEKLIQYNLTKVGESNHIFEGNGFTLSICLKESHICVHTWPELKRIHLDFFICNYSKDNEYTAIGLSQDIKNYIGGKVSLEKMILR